MKHLETQFQSIGDILDDFNGWSGKKVLEDIPAKKRKSSVNVHKATHTSSYNRLYIKKDSGYTQTVPWSRGQVVKMSIDGKNILPNEYEVISKHPDAAGMMQLKT
jgi:hypothetical protein